jgi:hypothetical protein
MTTNDSVVKPETKLYDHLPVIDLIVLNVASGLDDLKPVNVVQRLTGLCYCILYRIFDADFRRAGQLDLFVDVFAHFSPRGLVVWGQKAIRVPASKSKSLKGFFRVVSQGCHTEDSASCARTRRSSFPV